MKYVLYCIRFIGGVLIAFIYDFVVSTIGLAVIGSIVSFFIYRGNDIAKSVLFNSIASPLGTLYSWFNTTSSISEWLSNIISTILFFVILFLAIMLIDWLGGLLLRLVNGNKYLAILPSIVLFVNIVLRIFHFLFSNPMYPGYIMYYIVAIVVFFLMFSFYMMEIRAMWGIEKNPYE